ncbi:MAG: PspC domain-containing protein [Sphingomonas sp.]|nr:PspC domain-containing protein [Sphingomonas sp.]
MSMRGVKFELDRDEGKLLGVCAGIARTTGVDATVVRIGVVLIALFASFTVALVAYCGLAAYGHFQGRGGNRERIGARDEASPDRLRRDELRLRAIETCSASANSRLAREIEDLR